MKDFEGEAYQDYAAKIWLKKSHMMHYIINKFKSGDIVVEVTKTPDAKLVKIFEKNYTPEELTYEEKQSSIDVDIQREKIKD